MPRSRARLPDPGARPRPIRRAPLLTRETQAVFTRFEKDTGLPLLAY